MNKSAQQEVKRDGQRSRGRPPTMSEQDRRKLVIDAGFEQFLKHGYAGTTMSDVAEKAHISKRSIYELFDSKKDLFVALVVAHRQMMLALPRAGGKDLAHELEEIFGANVSDAAEQRRLAFVQLVIRESSAFPELGEMLHRHGFSESIRLLAQWLYDRRREGRLNFDDPVDCAHLLMHMVFVPRMPPPSDVLPPGRDGLPFDQTRWRKHLRFCIRVFLNGVEPRTEGDTEAGPINPTRKRRKK
jgi:AcrR family transcriptional regulator